MQIWRAGLDAVSPTCWSNRCCAEGSTLWIDDEPLDLARCGRIAVVGAGKAGAGMAAGFEQPLGPHWLAAKQVTGWINVPADCLGRLRAIHLHPARPAGVNEPTPEGVAGTAEILRRVESLSADDVCFVLLSGGGSALLRARGRDFAGRQARRHPAIERGRSQHRRAEHGPQTTQPDQRRRARPGVPCRADVHAGDFRRAGGSAGHDRLGPDRAR